MMIRHLLRATAFLIVLGGSLFCFPSSARAGRLHGGARRRLHGGRRRRLPERPFQLLLCGLSA